MTPEKFYAKSNSSLYPVKEMRAAKILKFKPLKESFFCSKEDGIHRSFIESYQVDLDGVEELVTVTNDKLSFTPKEGDYFIANGTNSFILQKHLVETFFYTG